MLKLFMDGSGGKPDTPPLVVGAYLATEERWTEFESEWTAVLAHAGVARFHATDFFACQKDFKGWIRGSKRHRAFAKRFAAIAESHTIAGFAHGMHPEAFAEIIAPLLRESAVDARLRRLSPLTIAASTIIEAVSRLLGYEENQAVALVENEHGVGDALAYFAECRAAGERWTRSIASFGRCDKSFLPAQAADLLAHEAWHDTKFHLGVQPVRRKVGALDRLLKRSLVEIRALTAANMESVRPHLQSYLLASGS